MRKSTSYISRLSYHANICAQSSRDGTISSDVTIGRKYRSANAAKTQCPATRAPVEMQCTSEIEGKPIMIKTLLYLTDKNCSSNERLPAHAGVATIYNKTQAVAYQTWDILLSSYGRPRNTPSLAAIIEATNNSNSTYQYALYVLLYGRTVVVTSTSTTRIAWNSLSSWRRS